MLQMTFACLEQDDLLIVGAQMRYQGIDHLKQYVSRRDGSLRAIVEEGLTIFLNGLKRPCRIDLGTDQYWLVESRWADDKPNEELTAAVRRHQITWTFLLPGCKAVVDVQKRLTQETDLCRKAADILIPGTVSAKQ